jgi:alpha-galactosidase
MKKIILFLISVILSMTISAQDPPALAGSPPMGWNSWDCFGMDVTDVQLMATADFMAKNLAKHGWEYIVLDMGWYFADGLNTNNFGMRKPPQHIDEYGRFIPSLTKFPSAASGKGLRPVGDYIHGLGLKFGIHILRGIPWQAVEQNTPIKGTSYRARDIANFADSCRWFHGLVGIDWSKPGAQEYYNSLLELYTDWGVDYIKADDILSPYRKNDIEGLNKAILQKGRPIVLSLSAGPVSVGRTDHLRQYSHLWRISGDMWDHWSFIKSTFIYCREWQDHIIPGHWPDCDMLPIGKMRINGTDGALAKRLKIKREETVNEYDRLTADEKYTLMTLWIIFRSPLMMGGNLLELNDFLMSLLTNDEALAVNQSGKNNKELRSSEKEIIWVADGEREDVRYVAFFNISDDQPLDIKVTWQELGIKGKKMVRDIWKKTNIQTSNKAFEARIPFHGCGFYKISNSEK